LSRQKGESTEVQNTWKKTEEVKELNPKLGFDNSSIFPKRKERRKA
jgi:hypothetical protein